MLEKAPEKFVPSNNLHEFWSIHFMMTFDIHIILQAIYDFT